MGVGEGKGEVLEKGNTVDGRYGRCRWRVLARAGEFPWVSARTRESPEVSTWAGESILEKGQQGQRNLLQWLQQNQLQWL